MNIPLNIDWQQILLHLLNFAILAVGLYLLLFRPVRAFMEKRRAYYEEMHRQAEEKMTAAEKLKNEYQARLDDAESEIGRLKEEEAARAGQETERKRKEAEAQAEKIIAEAEMEAQAKKVKIIESAQKEIAEMVVTATEKLVAIDSGPETDHALYEQFLAMTTKDAEESQHE